MPRNYAALPPNQVRRADRAITDDAWIEEFLQQAPIAATATVDAMGQPFINSNIFVFVPASKRIYIHTAQVGRTNSNIRLDGRVCLSVSEMGRLLPADTALEFSVEYSGVAVFGVASVVEDDAEAGAALQMLLDKYCPHLQVGRDYRGVTAEELKRTAVYRIEIESWSGKRKKAEDDFPGPFITGKNLLRFFTANKRISNA